MRHTLYRYNPEKCRYERIRVSPLSVVFYIFGIFIVATLMLAGMLALHDLLIDSRKEITLRKANSALEKNHVVLTARLNAIETAMEELGTEDRNLHRKFFGVPTDSIKTETSDIDNKQILKADVAAFSQAVKKIGRQSAMLLLQSGATSTYFERNTVLNKQIVGTISAIPVYQPIHPLSADKVLSGFGTRVNPFHKGLYEHPGIDIAAPRGEAVNATAPGVVVEIKRSTVEAGYGNFIEIDHGHGFRTRYAHLEEIKVKLNQKVAKGAVIGTVGNSGGSIAPHLHYEIIREGKNVDPVHYMIEGLSSREHHHLKLISQKQNQSLD